MTIHTRRTFLQTAGTFGVLASLGMFGRGCQRLEESALDTILGPDDGPFRPPLDGTIDEVAHVLQRLGYGARLGRLAAIRTVLGAGAPFLFAAGLEGFGPTTALAVALLVGIVALVPLGLLHCRVVPRRG